MHHGGSRFVFISDVGFHKRSAFVRPALVPFPVALFHSPVTFMTQFMSEPVLTLTQGEFEFEFEFGSLGCHGSVSCALAGYRSLHYL
jgi:hypothetical protein